MLSGCGSTIKLHENEIRKVNPLRWSDDIERFRLDDANNLPPRDAIVFVGSSSFTLWNDRIASDMAPLTVIPRGFGGSTMEDVLYYLDPLVLTYHPRAVVLYEGDNDIAAFNMTPQKVRNDFEEIASRIHSLLPKTRIYVVSVKPSPARISYWEKQKEVNILLKSMCESSIFLNYIDVASSMFDEKNTLKEHIFSNDKVHLNAEGYALWKSVFRTVLLNGEIQYEKYGDIEK